MRDDLKKCLHPTPILAFTAFFLIIGTIGAIEWETITAMRAGIQLAIGGAMIGIACLFNREEW